MCEDGAGQFHHGKTTNRIGSTVISLSGISLAGLLTALWMMHLNFGYNNNIFLCHGGKECVRIKTTFIHEKPIIFCCPASNSAFLLFQGTIVSWVFSNILSQRGHRIAKLIADYRDEELSSAVVPYVASS